MQIISNTPAALLDISAHAAKVQLDDADKKVIDSTSKALRELNKKAAESARIVAFNGREYAKATAAMLTPDHKREDIEAIKLACCLTGDALALCKRLLKQRNQEFHRAILNDAAALGEVAARAIDGIAEGVRSDAAAHEQAMASSPLAADVSSAEANARVSRTLDWLGEQRGKAIREGGEVAWGILQDLGLT